MKIDELITLYEEAKSKSLICLGIDNVDLNGNNENDEARQVTAFIVKESNDYLFAYGVEYIEVNDEDYITLKSYPHLIKIADLLNFLK